LKHSQILPNLTQIHKTALAELNQKVEKKRSLKNPQILVKARDNTTGGLLGKSLKVFRALSGTLGLGGDLFWGFFCLFR